MATQAPVKSPLHNFPLPYLKWGSKNHHHPRNRRSPPHPPHPPPPPPSTTTATVDDGKQQWNLRPRKSPPPPSPPPPPSSTTTTTAAPTTTENVPKSSRLRTMEEDKGEKRKFWISLSRDEIEEDIYSLTGGKPSRRPRKRPKNVQKQLDTLFPGLWLVGLTPEAYRGLDVPPKR